MSFSCVIVLQCIVLYVKYQMCYFTHRSYCYHLTVTQEDAKSYTKVQGNKSETFKCVLLYRKMRHLIIRRFPDTGLTFKEITSNLTCNMQ